MKNIGVRVALMKHNFRQYDLAAFLGTSEGQISKMLREELPEEEQARLIKIIKEAAAQREDPDNGRDE